jgi:hypothetical protein
MIPLAIASSCHLILRVVALGYPVALLRLSFIIHRSFAPSWCIVADMLNRLSGTTSSDILFILGLFIPGAVARAGASNFVPEVKTPSNWAEQMIAVWVSIIFWTVFYLPAAIWAAISADPFPVLPTPSLVLWAAASLMLVTFLLAVYRVVQPKYLDRRAEKLPDRKMPGGERSPWLMSMSLAAGENYISVFTKTRVVYCGKLKFGADRDDEGSIVVTLIKKGHLLTERPHLTNEDDFWFPPSDLPVHVVLDRSEIAAIEILDLRQELALKLEAEKAATAAEAARVRPTGPREPAEEGGTISS